MYSLTTHPFNFFQRQEALAEKDLFFTKENHKTYPKYQYGNLSALEGYKNEADFPVKIGCAKRVVLSFKYELVNMKMDMV